MGYFINIAEDDLEKPLEQKWKMTYPPTMVTLISSGHLGDTNMSKNVGKSTRPRNQHSLS